MLRDLEEARAKRIALENPPPEIAEDQIKLEPQTDVAFDYEDTMIEDDPKSLQPKLEDSGAVESQGPASDAIIKDAGQPVSNTNEVNAKDNAAGTSEKGPGTDADMSKTEQTVDPSVDSLLDISADGNNDDLNLNFDDMDFSQFTSNMEENSQSQTNDDFLSTFGNEHFPMPDLQATNTTANSNENTEDKKDDLLEMAANTDGHDMMDLDYFKPADESSFDDLFAGGDEVNMDNDNYDSAFYNATG